LGKLTKAPPSLFLHRSTVGSSPCRYQITFLDERAADAVSSSILSCGESLTHPSSCRTSPRASPTSTPPPLAKIPLSVGESHPQCRHLFPVSPRPSHLVRWVCLVPEDLIMRTLLSHGCQRAVTCRAMSPPCKRCRALARASRHTPACWLMPRLAGPEVDGLS
jgi:hypothetical protein